MQRSTPSWLRRSSLALGLCLAAACHGDAATTSPSDTSGPFARFGWATSDVAHMSAIETNRGHSVFYGCTLTLGDAGDRIHQLLRIRACEVSARNRRRAVQPVLDEELSPMLALLFTAPELVLDEAGVPRATRLSAPEAIVARMEATTGPFAPKIRQAVLDGMASPGVRGRVTGVVTELWNVWVGGWIGLPVTTGAPIVSIDRIVKEGVSLARTRVTEVDTDSTTGTARFVRATIIETTPQERLRMAEDAVGRPVPPEFEAMLGDRTMLEAHTVEAVVELATLRPRSVVVVEYRLHGAEIDEVRRATYSFTWPQP